MAKGPELRQEQKQRQGAEMQQLHKFAKQNRAEFPVKKMAINQIGEFVNEAYRQALKFNATFAREMQRNDHTFREECKQIIMSTLLERCASEIENIINAGRKSTSRTVREIDETLERNKLLVQCIFDGTTRLDTLVTDTHLGELERTLINIYEAQASSEEHFASLIQEDKVRCERLTPAHIPDIIALYEQYRFTYHSLLQLLDGENVPEKFIASPDLHESPIMKKRLAATEQFDLMAKSLHTTEEIDARGGRTPAQAAPVETMRGVVLISERGKMLGVSASLVSPDDPSLDPEYCEEIEQLLTNRESGGDMDFIPGMEDRCRKDLLGKGGCATRLFLNMGRSPGAGRQGFAEGEVDLLERAWLSPTASDHTYTLHNLYAKILGIPEAEVSLDHAQNAGMMKSVLDAHYTVGVAFNERRPLHNMDEAPYTEIFIPADKKTRMRVGIRPRWIYCAGKHSAISAWAKKNARLPHR